MNKEIESRRVSIERLANEGNSQEDIAAIMEVSLRTVERDVEAIRASNVIARDERLVAGQVVRLIARAEGMIGGLKKVAGRNDCPYAMRIAAELGAWKVAKELAQELRAMGYLPNAAKEVKADVTHRPQREQTAAELHERVVQFEKIVRDAGRMDEAAEKQIAGLHGLVAMRQHEEDRQGGRREL